MFKIILSVVLVATVSQAFAQEGVFTIALDKNQKQIMINALQLRIANHQRMSTEQITKDMQSALDQLKISDASSSLANLKTMATQELIQIGDRDTIVAIEQAELQSLMTSDNMIFGFSRELFSEIGTDNENPAYARAEIIFFLLPFTLAFDLIVLPATFIDALIYGF